MHSDSFCRPSLGLCQLQIVLSCDFPVSPWLSPGMVGIIEIVNYPFQMLPGFIEKREILRIPDIRRRTGRVQNQGPHIVGESSAIRHLQLILPVFRRYIRRCQNHFIDFHKELRRESLSKIHHSRVGERAFRLKRWVPKEILII